MAAFRGLDPDVQEPWVKQYLRDNGIADEQLVIGAEVFAKYLNSSMLDPQYKQPYEALQAVGFFDLPQAVQLLIAARLGQTLMSMFFCSIRDVIKGPEDFVLDKEAINKIVADTQQKIHKRQTSWWRRILLWLAS
jgi:hypothetical protein